MRPTSFGSLEVTRSTETFTAAGVTVALPIEHRVLRLGPVRIGRRSVRRIHATVHGSPITLRVPRVADPWATAALGTLVVWVSCAALLAAARWHRESRDAGPTHPQGA